MKKKNVQNDEREQILCKVFYSLNKVLVKKALLYNLSPLEMITVMNVLTYHLCFKASKHLNVDLPLLIKSINNSMIDLLEDEK